MTFARIRALIVVGILFLGAATAVGFAIVKDTQTGVVVGPLCPPGAVPANRTLPERRDVKLNVFNASKRAGLAAQVGTELKNRDFQVLKKQNAPRNQVIDKVAVIRYGPKTLGAAQEMNAYFLGVAQMDFHLDRTDDIVDIYLGTEFKQLATTTEVNQSIAVLGEPLLPPGTCDMKT